VDLLLSSGFLAFARHAGFLCAVEESGIAVEGLCGTSSGALAAALWAAGLSAGEVARELSAQRPIARVRPHWAPWRGLCSLGPLIERLAQVLPPTFEALERPFAVGVMAPDGEHRLLNSGPLPEAVAASCAVPYLFAPVRVEGTAYRDGGAADRLGLIGWRRWRGDLPLLVHLVERSYGAAGDDELGDELVVRTPASGARLWNLGDFTAQLEEARALTAQRLEQTELAR